MTFGTACTMLGPSLDGMVENRAVCREEKCKGEGEDEVLGANENATVAEQEVLVILLRKRMGLKDRAIFMSIESRHVQAPAGRTYLLIVWAASPWYDFDPSSAPIRPRRQDYTPCGTERLKVIGREAEEFRTKMLASI